MWELEPEQGEYMFMEYSNLELQSVLPLVTLESMMYIIIGLLFVRTVIHKILVNYFLIPISRPQHEITSLEYSYFYHLSIIILVLSEVNWNLFDIVIWIGSYVGVGFIRKAIHIVKIQKEIILNDYSYNNKIITLLSSSKIYGLILFALSLFYFFAVHLIFTGVPIKLSSLLLFPTLMLGVDSLFLFLCSAATSRDILCYYNQNINQIPPTYKLEHIEKIIGSSIRVWHYYNLFRLFLKAFMEKMGFFDCMWILSVVNACYISTKALVGSFGKYRSYNRLIEKLNKIFKRSKCAPDQMCIICMSQLLNCRKLISCGHMFHYKCLFQWVQTKNQCPICRGAINLQP